MRRVVHPALVAICVLALLLSGIAPGLAQDPLPPPAQLRDEAFQSAQKAMLTSASMALAQLGVRFAAGSDDLARLVRQRQDLVAAWKSADQALVQALGSADSGNDPVVETRRAAVDALQARIAESDGDMAARFPSYAELSQPQPVSIAATQALLGENEALVLVFVATRETFVWVVTHDAADWHRVPVERDVLVEQVKALRAGLDPGAVAVLRSALRDFGDTDVEGAAAGARVSFSRAIAHDLFRRILAPLDKVLAHRERVFVVAERPFDSLPFALLVTEPPQGDDTDPAALRQTAWLIRRQGIVTLPSVSSLRSLRAAAAAPPAPLPFRGYGAPLLGGRHGPAQVASNAEHVAGTLLRGGAVNLETVRSLSPLPQTEGELRRLAEALGAAPDSVQVGAAATKSAVQAADLSRYRVLAFATHGLLAGDIPGLSEPALVFTPPAVDGPDDGLLTASEAARLNLSADWVILSACNTAGGDGTPGADGLSGLARAFFYAGARTLLVSHWPVRDDAAARLTTGALAALRTEPTLAKAEAFRRATLALITDPSDPTLAHPAIWAPFVMVGEGR
ncbi:CHAT domain-containing protein [Xanthobacter autotrophicus]|uniref:CHAT domain-containing protein n=1 Tax=Xanthobacter TaxID=279 RepID=UPI0024AA849C|nr:CHAT domain-containing protein [Xanthobacter autotrophicus]MDI4662752.1 CHAT domain-containing protein [Xanthobacter autotrophicus]